MRYYTKLKFNVISKIINKYVLLAFIIINIVNAFHAEDSTNIRLKRATQSSCNYTYVPSATGCEVCGTVSYTQNARIVGGSIAVAYSWPAQVLIIQRISGTYRIPQGYGNYYTISKSYICGGTILNRYTILTAGHCIETTFDQTLNGVTYTIDVSNPYDASQYSVYVGAFDISFLSTGSSPTYPTVKMSVSKVIRHPNYNSANFLNDIAIYQLSSPIEFNQYVQPACLPDPIYGKYPPDNTVFFATGWGTLSEGGSTPNKLYNVRLTAYASTSCSNVETSYTKNWNSQLCGGLTSGGKDTCQGDSGGGIYVYDSTYSKYVVVGIVSYGEGCARVGKPGVYTRVSYYNDWIQSNIATSDATRKYSINSAFIMLTVLLFSVLNVF